MPTVIERVEEYVSLLDVKDENKTQEHQAHAEEDTPTKQNNGKGKGVQTLFRN